MILASLRTTKASSLPPLAARVWSMEAATGSAPRVSPPHSVEVQVCDELLHDASYEGGAAPSRVTRRMST